MSVGGAAVTEPIVKDLDQNAGSEVVETESFCPNCQENARKFL